MKELATEDTWIATGIVRRLWKIQGLTGKEFLRSLR